MAKPGNSGLIHGLNTAEIDELREQTQLAKKQAYCPYSKFQVGSSILLRNDSAAARTKNGEVDPIVSGANVENAAYPTGTCAERVAFGTAVFKGMKKGDVRAVFVSTNTKAMCSPCGQCRQFIREFCDPETPIFMFNVDGNYIVETLEALLPMSFGPENLRNAAVE